jgi:S-adenosyl methyltransferase
MTGRNPLDRAGPSVAGVYNHLLGGRDNFAADRELAAALTAICPIAADLAMENRAFLARAVSWAAQDGIGQYLDCGAGFPVSPVTHETARMVQPDARVAYLDTDPVVTSFAAALLSGPGITALGMELFPVPAVRTFYALELPHGAIGSMLLIAALGAATLAIFWVPSRRHGHGPAEPDRE